MNCSDFSDQLDDYVDGVLTAGQREALERHAGECTACAQRVGRQRQLRELLQDYGESVVPVPDAEYFDRALARAADDGARQQRNRWLMTTLAATIAAGVAVLVVGGLLFRTPVMLPAAAPRATLSIDAPRTVNLVFTASAALPEATLTLDLPPGVELAGFPDARQVRWRTSLARGRNLLPLTLIADAAVDAEVEALLSHGNADRRFRLRVISEQTGQEPPG